jgi:hypothetical protein
MAPEWRNSLLSSLSYLQRNENPENCDAVHALWLSTFVDELRTRHALSDSAVVGRIHRALSQMAAESCHWRHPEMVSSALATLAASVREQPAEEEEERQKADLLHNLAQLGKLAQLRERHIAKVGASVEASTLKWTQVGAESARTPVDREVWLYCPETLMDMSLLVRKLSVTCQQLPQTRLSIIFVRVDGKNERADAHAKTMKLLREMDFKGRFAIVQDGDRSLVDVAAVILPQTVITNGDHLIQEIIVGNDDLRLNLLSQQLKRMEGPTTAVFGHSQSNQPVITRSPKPQAARRQDCGRRLLFWRWRR